MPYSSSDSSATPRWATTAQAADYTGYSIRTIRQRITDGVLPARKPRGSRIWLIDLNDADAMIRGTSRASQPGQGCREAGGAGR